MGSFTPYIRTPRGVFNDKPHDTLESALAKYEEWAKDYRITSAWIDERLEIAPFIWRYKVKLVGVLKKEEGNVKTG